jgi:hypothetical protein
VGDMNIKNPQPKFDLLKRDYHIYVCVIFMESARSIFKAFHKSQKLFFKG